MHRNGRTAEWRLRYCKPGPEERLDRDPESIARDGYEGTVKNPKRNRSRSWARQGRDIEARLGWTIAAVERKSDGEPRTLPHDAFDVDPALVFRDDAVAEAQTEARPGA